MYCCIIGACFRCRLFEICPEVLQLFPFADEPVINSETEGLVKHGLDVMGVIDSALSMVVNMEIDKLVDFLVELGLAHSLRNVEPKHFAVSYSYSMICSTTESLVWYSFQRLCSGLSP